MKIVTVVLADAFEMIRESIAYRLEMMPEKNVIGEATTGYDTIKLCRQLKPDIVLLDIDIAGPSGFDTLIRIKEISSDTKVVIMANDPSPTNAFFAISHGATGFVSKKAKGVDIVNAITAVANNYTYLPAGLLDDFVQSRKNVKRCGNPFGLSPREVEIMEACISGRNTKEVAQDLQISVRTVETHRGSIYRKTDCNSVDDLKRVSSTLI